MGRQASSATDFFGANGHFVSTKKKQNRCHWGMC